MHIFVVLVKANPTTYTCKPTNVALYKRLKKILMGNKQKINALICCGNQMASKIHGIVYTWYEGKYKKKMFWGSGTSKIFS